MTTRRWKVRVALGAAAMVVGTMAYMWLPSLAALFLYKGSVTAPEAADPAALAMSQKLIAARTSFSNLLRLDGLVWWPKTRNAALYGSIPIMLLTSVPAFVAFLALRTRARVVAWFWLAARWLRSVVGIFSISISISSVLTSFLLIRRCRITCRVATLWATR